MATEAANRIPIASSQVLSIEEREDHVNIRSVSPLLQAGKVEFVSEERSHGCQGMVEDRD
jgi:hypothetical protein